MGEQEKWVILSWCVRSILYDGYHSTEQLVYPFPYLVCI